MPHSTYKFIFVILVIYFAGCTSSKETRYEQKPKEEKTETKPTTIMKSMEVRERELIKKLKISSVDRINFELDARGNLINKGKISSSKYNQKGFLVETIIFDGKGRVENRYEYKYDSKGLRTESLRYNAQNQLDKKYTYEYDNLGNKIRSTRSNANGKEEKYYLYEYDAKLNLISDEWYDISGNLEYKIETEYDDARNKSVSYSHDENGDSNFKFIFKYDDKQNLIEEQKFNGNKLVGIIQYLYKYY